MTENRPVTGGDFLKWLLLVMVTFGIYGAWWQFSRLETSYRANKRGLE